MGVTRSGTGCKICGLEPTSWAVRFISNKAGFKPGLETAGAGTPAAEAEATVVALAPLAVAVAVVVGDSLNFVHWLASLVELAAAPAPVVIAAAAVVDFSAFGELEMLRCLSTGVVTSRLELPLLA